MTQLFEPFTLKDITLRNRVGVSPMCQYSYRDGFSNDWQVVHLGTRAAGGAGLIIAEATAVEAPGRITPFDVGIWSDEHIEPLQRVTRVIKDNGAVAGIQIGHAGRKACTGQPWTGGKPVQPDDPDWWQVVGASPLAFSPAHQVPASSGWSSTARTATCCNPSARPFPTNVLTTTGDHSRTACAFLSKWCRRCAACGRSACR